MQSSARLTYRRPVPGDLSSLHGLDNDPDVMAWINGGQPVSLELFAAKLLPVYLVQSAKEDDAPQGFWIIESAGEFLGWVSLRPAEEQSVAAIGYRLKKSAWGKGYATEAAAALLHAAFGDRRLDRVTATTYEANVASQRVLEKIGLKLVGKFRLDAQAVQSVETSISIGEVWDGFELAHEISREQYLSGSSR